jgi:Protein of unknown function (DUF4232)
MKYLSSIPKTVRRTIAVIATASAAGLIATAALAATSSGTTLAADTSAAAVPLCTAGDIGAWVAVDQGNGAAGSIYYPLQFTNLSAHSCSLRGFPGVSAINRNGHQLGRPAGWDHVIAPRTVTLAPGATAHTILRYSDVVVSTSSGCDPVFSTFELRVYLPGQYTATHAAFDLEACSHAGPVYMSVEPIRSGVGTIYG